MTLNTAKKGITAVVAIVLLLMMTVASAGLAYMWISQMQTGTQQKTTEQLNAQQQQMQGALAIESAWNSGVPPALGNLQFAIRNVGTTALSFGAGSNVQFYVDGVLTGTPATLTAVGTLAPGAASTALIDTGSAYPAAGVSKTIKIVTKDGVTAEYKCSPQTTGQKEC